MKSLLSLILFGISLSYFAQIPTYPSLEKAVTDVKSDSYWNNKLMKDYGIEVNELTFKERTGFEMGYSDELYKYRKYYDADMCVRSWIATVNKEDITYTFIFQVAYTRSRITKLDVIYENKWTYYSRRSGFFPPQMTGKGLEEGKKEKEEYVWNLFLKLKGETKLTKEKHGIEGDVASLKTFASFYSVTVIDKDYLESLTVKQSYLSINGFVIERDRNNGWIKRYDESGSRRIYLTSHKINGNWVPVEVTVSGLLKEPILNDNAICLESYGTRTFQELVNKKYETQPEAKHWQYQKMFVEKVASIFQLIKDSDLDGFLTKVKPFIHSSSDKEKTAKSIIALILEGKEKLCTVKDFEFKVNSASEARPNDPFIVKYTYTLVRPTSYNDKKLGKYYKENGMSKTELKRNTGSRIENKYGGYTGYIKGSVTLTFIDNNWVIATPAQNSDIAIRF